MTTETELFDKLSKIEALLAGDTTAGEKAGAAADRIRTRLEQAERREKGVRSSSACPIHGRVSCFVRSAVAMASSRTGIIACSGRASL